MKKSLKKLVTVVLAIAMMVVLAIPAYAADEIYIPKTANGIKYSTTTLKNQYFSSKEYFAYVGNQKVTVKSSNKSVATVKAENGTIFVTIKKPGKTTISVKTAKKTYKCEYTVSKYENPLASVKVGGTTIKGSSFNKNAVVNLKYSKYANKKTAVKFNLKSGWKVLSVEYVRKGWARSETVKNGGKVKVAGGSGFAVSAYVVNEATGIMESVDVYFK